ncbi:MAG TPA: glycosyltransferase family 2 protein, partial [Rhodothermales bacterium]|nr:glycosyltransferase family 2 protein [Rhodothermales bacterium]
MSAPAPTLSVIVPAHFGGEGLGRCVAALRAATPPPDEIVVVADGETDGAWRGFDGPDLRVIVRPHAGGPAAARNAGARAARGDVLFFVDADVVVRPDTLARVRRAFAEDAGLAALIGSYDDTPGDPGFLSQYRNLLHHHTHQTAHGEARTFWGACGAIRQAAFHAVGGFDEAYREPSVEDIELGYRLVRAGHG